MWIGEIGEDSRLALLAQAVALPADVDCRREVQQAIQNGRGQHLVREDVAPLAIGLVAGQDDAVPLVAATDQLEQELGRLAVEREVAHLVQDEQLGATQRVEPMSQAVLLGILVDRR